mgnify:CR=1 FL=1
MLVVLGAKALLNALSENGEAETAYPEHSGVRGYVSFMGKLGC